MTTGSAAEGAGDAPLASPGARWTREEDEELVAAVRAGADLAVIAEQRGRTRGAIVSRLLRMIPAREDFPEEEQLGWIMARLADPCFDWRTPFAHPRPGKRGSGAPATPPASDVGEVLHDGTLDQNSVMAIAELLTGFTAILSGCAVLLRPGGLAVVTARPWRQHGELVDLPAAVIAAGARAGLVPVARCVALLAGLRGGRLIARPSFFQLDNLRRARAKGQPWHLIVHEDVLIFRNPPFPGSPAAARPQPAHEGGQPDARPCPGRTADRAA